MKKEKKTKKEEKCLCPYCEEEVVTSCALCHACGAVLSYCVSCQIIVPDKEATKCPQCGTPLKRGKK